MDELNVALVSVIGIVVALLIFGGVQFFSRSLARRWNRHKADTIDKWEAEGVEFTHGPTAIQFGGQESLGERTPRGVGYIALTENDLRLTCALPSTKWWIVSFKQIKGVALKTRFMGKAVKQTPFIVIRFKQEGETERLAFQVKAVDDWSQAIAEAAGVAVKT